MSAEPAISPQVFAQRVLAAFEDVGRLTDLDVDRAGGPSSTTMTKYRKVAAGAATMPEPRGDTYRAIDAAAGWRPGSARALWRRGVEPEVVSADRAPTLETLAADNARMRSELRELRTLVAEIARQQLEPVREDESQEQPGESA